MLSDTKTDPLSASYESSSNGIEAYSDGHLYSSTKYSIFHWVRQLAFLTLSKEY